MPTDPTPTHRLILLRHAKTEPVADSDAARELTDRGRAQSQALSEVFDGLVRGTVHAYVSSAVRALQTWQLAATGIESDVTSEVLDSLYTADSDALLALVRATDDRIETLVVVGHNPTIADVVARLAADGTGAAHEMLRARGYAPSTVTVFELSSGWSSVDSTNADLTEYVPPQA